MPGIYVRKASWLDWTQKGENTILTVPGSYWLCHKSNIYKFIFRYHRITRNVKQFSFGKELMNVVRRIIKHQPRQGQQFGTTHLLVTYNYASWTRQDKMFAMIKFKERSVAAFSHAFVLTIKVCCPLESTDRNTIHVATSLSNECSIPSIENSNNAHPHETKIENESKKDLLYSCNNTSKKNAQCNDTQEKVLELKNKESMKKKRNNENTNKFNKSLKDNTIKLKEGNVNKDVHNSMLLDTNSIIIEGDEIDEVDEVDDHSTDFIYLEKTNNKDETLCVEKTNVNTTESDKHQTEKESTDYKTNLVSNSNNNNSIVDNANTDSVNLPYQYLIEKEIENEKHNASDFKNCLQETKNSKRSCDQHEQNSKKHKLEDVNEDEKDLSTSKKRKCTVDNITARSSDITNLVMEGLMFTIRQGQDTVAVIEQKTKLDVDEVLENSEKIETQEGEKRLRNSSLLGLENLITMIDLPKQITNGYNDQNKSIQQDISKNQSLNNHPFDTVKCFLNDIQSKSSYNNSPLPSTSVSSNNTNLYITNNCQYLAPDDAYKFEENMKFEKHKYLNHTKEEEEEDIIPEALQNNSFQLPINSLKEVYEFNAKFMENDKCTFFPSNSLSPYKCLNAHSSNEVTNTSVTSKSLKLCSDNVKTKINAPTIISNQTIGMTEIPLPLQRILKNKLSTSSIPLIKNNKTDKRNIQVHEKVPKIQSHEKEKIVCNVHSETKSHNDHNNGESESMSPAVSKIEIKNTTSEKKSKNVEEVSSNKIQDITEEFYQDLSYLQKKKHLRNEKYVESRKSPLNALRNTNYGDMHLEVVKLFQDITRGAKVVVKRISINKCS
ncbi:uncharacterized protein LOC117602691 [Osmia lignaria lignaria]|uniref:uncharacterized protein LOC117602691 n=1 Tax=Osmia lignaria lignaria TaxID=1437193 RepID=UPI00402B4737